MCGRYTLLTEQYDFGAWFGVTPPAWLVSRYNIAPSYNGTGAPPIIRLSPEGQRELVVARWWLIPSWWKKNLKELPTAFNARAEELDAKPFFREAFRRRRCLVPASGWYEYRGPAGHKESWYFHAPRHEPLAFGGVWEEWVSPAGEVVASFAIVTTAANAVAQPIHGRMPLVLPKAAYDAWLDPQESGAAAAKALMQPPREPVQVYRTSGFGNDPRREGPECLSPLGSGVPS